MIQIFPVETLNRDRSIPFAQHSRYLFTKEILPKWDYNILLEEYKKYLQNVHGIRFCHLEKIDSFPLVVYEMLEQRRAKEFDNALLKFAVSELKQYLKWDNRRKKYIYCVNSEGKELFIKLNNRFSEEYMNKIKKRMRELTKRYNDSKTVLLTLTLDPKKFDSRLQMWTEIKKELNRFLTSLRYNMKKQGRKFPEYLCTIQAQKNGNPHIHIIFFNATRLLDWREIEKLWHLGFIFINRSSSGGRVHHPVSYVTRYITRTFTKTTDNNLLTQALVWFFGIRSYTCSRGLVTPLSGFESDFTALCFILLHPDEDIENHLQHIHRYVSDVLHYEYDT